MQFADAPGRKAHIDAGDFAGDGEFGLRHLTSPAAVLNASRRKIKGGPELRQAADIGWRRIEERRHLLSESRIVWARNRESPRIGDVDRALRGQIRIAEGRGPSQRRGDRGSAGGSRGENAAP